MSLRITATALLWVLSLSVLRAADTPVSPTTPTALANSESSALSVKVTNAAKTDSKSANDQLLLDSTLVTGNRELPKVMYIVPWKRANLGDLPGQPFNTLLDEALAPVDRDVFQREVKYYQVIADKDHPGAQSLEQQATPSADKN
ncbi:MAG: hypothetical protein AB7F79_08935 [Steroidobacteraceae bacterium]